MRVIRGSLGLLPGLKFFSTLILCSITSVFYNAISKNVVSGISISEAKVSQIDKNVIKEIYSSDDKQSKQQQAWKYEKITLNVKGMPLNKVLQKVEKLGGIKIIQEGVILNDSDKGITVTFKDRAICEVLSQLLASQDVKIRYNTDRQVILEPIKSTSKSSYFINGKVVDNESGEPLIAAGIIILEDGKETTSGGVTDIDGKFSLDVKPNQIIKVSCIGYRPFVMKVTHSISNIKISLELDSEKLDEVVVTGISTRNKNSFTGNFVSVKGEELRQLNPNNLLNNLQFFDPSFKVLENNMAGSDPNALPEFSLRGDQSLGAGGSMNSMDLMLDNVSSRPNTPLFVLDGFVVPMSRVLQLDPERVAEITLLKDAAATSIYGSKASNGVLVIRTKVAPDGALTVAYRGNMTVQMPDLTDYNMMNAEEKLNTEWKAGIYNPNSAIQMNEYNRYLRNVLGGVNTYWLSQPLKTAIQSRNSLNISGGTQSFRYGLDMNLTNNPGVMKGSANDSRSVNFNMSYHRNKFTFGVDINLTETEGHNSPYGNFSEYTRLNPYYRPKNEDGEYEQILDTYKGAGSRIITNPLYNANVGIKDKTSNLNINTSLNLEYRILENLRISERLSYTRGMARVELFLPANHTNFATESDLTRKGSYRKNTGEMTSWSSNLGVNYNLQLKKHLVSLFGNWMISQDGNNYVNLSATGYPDVHMDDFIFGNKMNTNPSGTESLSRSMSVIGQFSYSYDNRYSFDYNLSGEASSRYSNHNLVPFWSTGFRWNAHREKWLKKYVSNLVFRATYGITGDQNFSPYEAIEFYNFTNTMKPYTSFPVLGAVLEGLNNPNLKWAKTHNLGLGVDFSVLKNRINITFNYYDNITKQLLTNYDLAPSTGFASQTMNAGELQNRGFDASINVIAIKDTENEFFWTLSLNANHNKNKIRKISDYLKKINEKQLASSSAPLPIYQEGQSTSTIYMVRSLGIDPMTGKEVYLTRDNKKTFVWNSVDKVPVGNTTPDISGAFSSSINWKDFSCAIGLTYKYGGVIYNQTLVNKIENSNVAYNLDRRANEGRWEKEGDVVRYVKFNKNGAGTPASTRFLMDDNVINLSSINLGYRFRANKYPLLNKLNVDLVSLSFITNNIARISPVRMERGLNYPFARSYTMSVSVIFK